MKMNCARSFALIVSSIVSASALGQASFGSGGYAENFDSMGTSGTVLPIGWKHFVTSFGNNNTWISSVPASGANSVASMAVSTAATILTATTTPSGTNNNGFNAANTQPSVNVNDRVLATSPTTVAGAKLQLSNDTGSALLTGSQFSIAFDTVRYTSVSSANDLPGYWLFVSVDGINWANIGPNPNIATVPNTAGITSSTLSYTLSANWLSSSSIYFRWVDDNATQTSPDQIIGLNNVAINLVPTPGASALLLMGSLAVAKRRR
jgi:hypothetical protein